MNSTESIIPPVQIYLAVSAALLAPVLLWPALLLFSDHVALPHRMHELWLILASAMLLCAVTADTIIDYTPDARWPAYACGWILTSTIGITIALIIPAGDWLLAAMFAIHSTRSMRALWKNKRHWKLWPAWSRDITAAMALFIWPTI